MCPALASADYQGDNHEVNRSAEEALFKPKQLTEAELLKANPLKYYDTTDLPTTIPSLPAPPSARKPPRSKQAAYVAQPWTCPTGGATTKDAKGKIETRMFQWDAVYRGGQEWSFEEIRARERGLLGKDSKEVQAWERAWHKPGCKSRHRSRSDFSLDT